MENKTEQFPSKGAVREITALSDATLKRLEIAGDFPARRLVAGRRVAWLASEVTEWMQTRTKVVLQTASASSIGRVSD
jgi:prophage regulatory protein